MVGSVVNARDVRARPDKTKRADPAWDIAAVPRSVLRRRARRTMSSPLMINVAVMMNPYLPRASPLGQSKVGSLSGCQPRLRMKSY